MFCGADDARKLATRLAHPGFTQREMPVWNRRRSIDSIAEHGHRQLRRTLSWPHLIALGVGAIVGTGIYTLIGVGADRAGPAVILAFAIAGLVCACAALTYAELATMIPAAGSAYTYSYVVIGEPVAWFVGWALILEYTVVSAAVAVGWSGYATGFLASAGIHLPSQLLTGPYDGGVVNLPAVLITVAIAGLLGFGTRESATINSILVVVKMGALAVFVAGANSLQRCQLLALHAVRLCLACRTRPNASPGERSYGSRSGALLARSSILPTVSATADWRFFWI